MFAATSEQNQPENTTCSLKKCSSPNKDQAPCSNAARIWSSWTCIKKLEIRSSCWVKPQPSSGHQPLPPRPEEWSRGRNNTPFFKHLFARGGGGPTEVISASEGWFVKKWKANKKTWCFLNSLKQLGFNEFSSDVPEYHAPYYCMV